MKEEVAIAAGRPASAAIHLTCSTVDAQVRVALTLCRKTWTCPRTTHSTLANTARKAILARRWA